MSWVIVAHDDGRRFSVRDTDPRANGAPGWTAEGAETEQSFVTVGVPKPKRPRNRPRAKDAVPIVEPEG